MYIGGKNRTYMYLYMIYTYIYVFIYDIYVYICIYRVVNRWNTSPESYIL